MVRKFIDLEEAAKMLGVSTETLSEMRERGKVHGYRDGSNWKFKPEEIERVIAEREEAEQEGEFAEIDEDPDSILLSEVELGQSDESTSSTIIGGKSSRSAPADSDIQLAAPKPPGKPASPSDSALDVGPASEVLGGSDLDLKSGSGVSPLFDELDTLDLDLPSAADSGISSKVFSDLTAGSGSAVAGGSGLNIGSGAGSDISLGSDALSLEGSALGFSNSGELSLGEANDDDDQLLPSNDGGSAIDLASDEDGDLVLGGSSHGDLSRTGDSGISLLNPSDSGFSLESAPMQLGSGAAESLELGEDDMLLSDDEDLLQPASAPAASSDEQSDDDFLLTPLEEGAAEESDSGSQVIALEGDVEFEEVSAGSSSVGLEALDGGLLEDDLGDGLGGGLGGGLSSSSLGSAALAAAPAPMTMPAGGAVVGVPAVEAPFSGWNVASLAMCAVVLLFIGMFTFDLLRNMWSWNGPYAVNSSLMDMVLSWFE